MSRKCLSVLFALAFTVSAVAITPEEVIANARKASNYAALESKSHGVLGTGRCDFLGVEGKYSLMFTAAGEFLETVETSIGQVMGFDGKTGWARDWSGLTRILEMEDLEVQQTVIWIWTGRWMAKNSPFEITVEGEQGREVSLAIKLRAGRMNGTMVVDGETWTVSRFSRKSAAGPDVWSFSRYDTALGFKIAHKVVNEAAGMTNSFTLEKVSEAPIFVKSPYEMPPTKPSGVKFDGAKPPEVEAKRAFSGHLLVHPLINGKDVGWFIFDTGSGSMVIDPKIADDLGLSKMGRIPAVGVGGVVEAAFRKADEFSLGPVSWRDVWFVEFDLSEIGRIFGVKLAGICGYDLLGRAVVEVEPTKGTVSLHNPETYTLSKGKWVELHIDAKHPVVPAKFEGDREGLFRLDTGANNTLIFHTSAVEAFNLLDGRETRKSAIAGVGGSNEVRIGKIEYFEIGEHRFDQPTVMFATSKEGPLAEAYTLGNIGQGFLRPFKIVFDYPRRRVAFLKSE